MNARRDPAAAERPAPGPRVRLPNRRKVETTKVSVGGQSVYYKISRFSDGSIAEVFVDMHRSGSAVRGMMHAVGILLSIAIQHGVPLTVLTDGLKGISFEPNGIVQDDPAVVECTSVVDFLARTLEAQNGPCLSGAEG